MLTLFTAVGTALPSIISLLKPESVSHTFTPVEPKSGNNNIFFIVGGLLLTLILFKYVNKK